jgi:hypothetical protein
MEKSFGRERRRYPRLSANFVVSYKIKNIPNDYDLSQTKNVGQGGVLFTTNQKFTKGTQLAIMVKFPFVPQRIEILGTVVDSKEIAKGILYETRLSFVDLNKKFFQELGEFIGERLGKSI